MTPRESIIRYKLAARTFRRLPYGYRPEQHRMTYAVLEAARAAMLGTLGYDRAYSYMGEFCNLHERDFPGAIHPMRTADGGYQYSGWQRPISLAEHRETLRQQRRRALYLARMFCRPPVERFMLGWHVQYRVDVDSWFTAARRLDRATGSGYLLILEHIKGSMFGRRVHSRRPYDEDALRDFFHHLDSPIFQDVYGIDRDDPAGESVESN